MATSAYLTVRRVDHGRRVPRKVTAREHHRCLSCHVPIRPGDRMTEATFAHDPDWTVWVHEGCAVEPVEAA